MAVKLKWPWLGIAIPCFLISSIGYCSHLFILLNFFSPLQQIWFQFSLTSIWISYYLAIYTDPGTVASNFEPSKREWRNYCRKCNNYKPPRAHHCKTCNKCVLMMDHHCPWTMNCVGYKNFAPFMRFIFWVITTTGFLFYHLICRIMFLWKNRNLPNYLVKRSELIFLTILTPLDGFVLLTITALLIRCLNNQIFGGMSQIESWELERLQSLFNAKRLIPLLLESAWELFPQSREQISQVIANKSLIQQSLRFDDVVNFPYDLSPWENAVQLLGHPFLWLSPIGRPLGDGMSFPKNDIAEYTPDSPIEDILLALPWPPDGASGKSGSKITMGTIETRTEGGEQLVRRRPADRWDLAERKDWQNEWGENLTDFGVDIDTEQIG
ncbi:hypothetical protein HG537_0G04530 [Torulaspora globosa]|uniref:Palmitoyltransferase PFA4 n=1 Tax=Torulaspora globosa TaxID=48254 RepID=A0A7H9HWV0_9SACH|nr:hypothetical protein HG537_0G04530 [Torulaspora sp. CBS 2947]